MRSRPVRLNNGLARAIAWVILLILVPLALAAYVLGIGSWDLSIPLLYGDTDHIWQLALNKVLYETGWVLTNPYLGAPEVASWHHNSSAQTSALHSVFMLLLSPFVDDAVRLQQVYYVLNFPLICITSFVACRLLGISRLPAFCVGLLFAFTKFRIDEMLYSYLPNYFMVPLALVAVIWVLAGRFFALCEGLEATGVHRNIRQLLSSREFVLGLVFVLLTAVADGYYAFFTLLLLGFAAFARVLLGDWRRPLSLLPVGAYIFALVAVALLLQLPLNNYKKANWNEFYPNGIADPVLTKHPFEADVYSSSLKLLVAPNEGHRIKPWGALGKQMVESSDDARRYRRGNYWPLGTLGSMLLGVALTLLAFPALKKKLIHQSSVDGSRPGTSVRPAALGDALLPLALFILLASIVGGIGSLVALFFPTIRAYDRFPVFLIFVLYLGAAWFATNNIQTSGKISRARWIGLICLVTAAALCDQIPANAHKGQESTKSKFVAERRFVQRIEAELPAGAMVYQYPYSQYLRDNKYYGWGSFAHIRLYLHSRQLRWSNGGAKNSPADDWNLRIAHLPLEHLISEVEAVGFGGLVIDRTVLKPAEYESLRRTLANTRYDILEDELSKLTFVRLRDPGFRLIYDRTYRQADRIVVTDTARLLGSTFPTHIDGKALKRLISGQQGHSDGVVTKSDHPEIFGDSTMLTRGLGLAPITPTSDMLGDLR